MVISDRRGPPAQGGDDPPHKQKMRSGKRTRNQHNDQGVGTRMYFVKKRATTAGKQESQEYNRDKEFDQQNRFSRRNTRAFPPLPSAEPHYQRFEKKESH
jgi:hypothetical protein